MIEVIPYNPDWPNMFEKEAAFIKNILREHCLEIHHIGSTAVPQLHAKQDLDILCVVDELQNSLILQNLGYTFKGELNIPLRYYLSKNTMQSKVNLHIVEKEHGFIKLNLYFRDYLRANDEARKSYAMLKEELLKDPTSYIKISSGFTGYNLGKDKFIKSILQKAGFNGFSVNFCMHDNEWVEYRRIREEQIFIPIQIIYDRNHPTILADNNYHFVLYKGIIIVSIAQIELLNTTEAALRSFATDTPYKKLGYGTYLMQILEKWVKQQGRKVIKIHTNLMDLGKMLE